MDKTTDMPPFRLGVWLMEPSRGVLTGADGAEVKLEPKVADLLCVLARAGTEVVSRDRLFAELWPEVTVGEDTLTRAVFKLRRALGDAPKNPSLVETVPKRGYRLMVAPEPAGEDRATRSETRPGRRLPRIAALTGAVVLLLAGGLWVFGGDEPTEADRTIAVAADRYMEATRADNEAAIKLYERALAERRPDPRAEAGLAAALVQRVVRWPAMVGLEGEGVTSMSAALQQDLIDTPEGRETLRRARLLAERAVRSSPRDPDAWRVLGLVKTAQRDLPGAFEAYEKALQQDPQDWKVLTNLSELHDLRGEFDEGYALMVEGYEAMGEAYGVDRRQVAKWRAPLGVGIARRDLEAGRREAAERWYRRTLDDSPYDREATKGYAGFLIAEDRQDEAARLCADYKRSTGNTVPCSAEEGDG
ncbi:winged helix-turn-helix domain-containing protein [Parvularcula maris]|uniref:Winged helix-turn-helix domain-containing protein n=1 Tax=Parvularcula maris TaxID=2965077 RepID=A0A9X2RIU0_9PROT|nr:winged helix-turn-helix domain-containing protein [Parvularcula maris]MCQ8186450.1 winged helix-turn-helix domain-containing protein [Parvularcula maris]